MDTLQILLGVQTLLLGLIGFLLKTIFTDYKEHRAEIDRKVDEIEKNYLHRFDDVQARIAASEKEIIKVVTQLKYEHGNKNKTD